MAIHIIIDGYNLIRQSAELSLLDRQDLQQGREALLEMLWAYKKVKHHRITVVFDGTDAYSLYRQRDQVKGITVLFSHRGETADTVIKRLSKNEKEGSLVVSSDRAVVNYAASQNAATLSSPEFMEKLIMASWSNEKGISPDEEMKGWNPTTRKKGPNRRLSKKERRNRLRARKL
ncbi:MAG: NYN domain-containing protein [Deltaproteobacteria bacterium]|nr:NYN domain-containing protein [Deltaproteobacteria bacterium]MBW2175963.1 NYN domain-containing protein [Deltaproteobacteria bacterium]MBW2677412.1 NYN domain-containing protein [Deltaproteobacteria bacterium]